MSYSHLERLRNELTANHWVIVAEHRTIDDSSGMHWKITRPNGDTPLTIKFTPDRDGPFGAGEPLEELERTYACDILGHDDIPHLYFGSYSGQFQRDVVAFVSNISHIDQH